MRRRFLIVPLLLVVCAAAAGAAVTAHAAGDRQHSFSDAATQLRAQWDRDVAAGVPAASLSSLRAQLSNQAPTAAWWSPNWIGDDGTALIDKLRAETQAAWNAALDAERGQAQALITQWSSFASQQSAWLTSDATNAAGEWSNQLASATSPAAVAQLVSAWQAFLAQQHTAVIAAQQAKLATALRSAGGPQNVLATARRLVAVAAGANLDAGNVATLAAQLSSQVAAGDSVAAITTGEQLLPAIA